MQKKAVAKLQVEGRVLKKENPNSVRKKLTSPESREKIRKRVAEDTEREYACECVCVERGFWSRNWSVLHWHPPLPVLCCAFLVRFKPVRSFCRLAAAGADEPEKELRAPKKKKSRLLGDLDLDSEEVQKLLKKKSKHEGQLDEVSIKFSCSQSLPKSEMMRFRFASAHKE